MGFTNLIKNPVFWKHTLRIAIMFVVLMTVISLLFNSFSDILKFNISAVAEKNFTNGKWVQFFGLKFIISILYAGYLTFRNMKQ